MGNSDHRIELGEDVDPDEDPSFRIMYAVVGPIRYMSSSMPLAFGLMLLCVGLTVISQLFGLLLWISLPLLHLVFHRVRLMGGRTPAYILMLMLFLAETLMTAYVIVPALAPRFGRVPLPCSFADSETLVPHSKWSCFFMRNYVTPPLHAKAVRVADGLAKAAPGTVTRYLDANFPFWKHFPMLPHLSHSNGRKLDVALAYHRKIGDKMTPVDPPTLTGYWAYAQPTTLEPKPCFGKTSSLRWNLAWLQKRLNGAEMDPDRTRALIASWLADEEAPVVKRLLLEPHLTARLELGDERVRFQGCDAARHDDHFHLEI